MSKDDIKFFKCKIPFIVMQNTSLSVCAYFLLKAVHYDRCMIADRQFKFFLVLQLIGNCHFRVLGCATLNTTEHNLHCTHSDFHFLFPDQALSVLSKINSQRVRKVEQIAHNGVEVSL